MERLDLVVAGQHHRIAFVFRTLDEKERVAAYNSLLTKQQAEFPALAEQLEKFRAATSTDADILVFIFRLLVSLRAMPLGDQQVALSMMGDIQRFMVEGEMALPVTTTAASVLFGGPEAPRPASSSLAVPVPHGTLATLLRKFDDGVREAKRTKLEKADAKRNRRAKRGK